MKVVYHERNLGKGAAVRTALQHATEEFAAILDADLEYRAADLAHVLEPLVSGEAHVVFGTRAWTSQSSFSFWYVMGNKSVTLATNVLYNCWISDVMTCHKAMRTELFRSLPLRERGFADRAGDRRAGAARRRAHPRGADLLPGARPRGGQEAHCRRRAPRAADARSLSRDVTRALVAGAYAALGALLVGTRLVRARPRLLARRDRHRRALRPRRPAEILAGHYIPNNHELFSLLGWATSSVVGESEIALRLWSVIPFLLGVGLVTAWLHVRVSPLSGVLFLFFATLSPLLLDLSRQARGYGIAFCAMGALVVGALEAHRRHATSAVVSAALAGVIGTWTLPVFGIAAVATLAITALRERPPPSRRSRPWRIGRRSGCLVRTARR